jgi:nicotinate-nucleotide adenylyltransferase
VEVDRPGPTYTVETLAKLKDEWPNKELVLILGEDALADLPNWRDPERIRDLATLVVARRGEGDGADETAKTEGTLADEGVTWLAMPRIEISASAIRERVRSGLPVRDLVPEAVAEYIDQHGMYRP